MTPNRLNIARSGKTPMTDSTPNSRPIDLSHYTSPGLNFDQVIPHIGQKIVYTDLRLELTVVTALRPFLNAGLHSLAQIFEDGEDMQLMMLPTRDEITPFAVFKDGRPLSSGYACPTKRQASLAWETVLEDQWLRQNLPYPVPCSQESLDFCRMAPPLIAPSGPFITHQILPGHFEHPGLFQDLLQFEAHLFCTLSHSKDTHAFDRN